MGKYINKTKIAGDVSVKPISHPTTSGFRTRAAKSLALQRLRSHSNSPPDDADPSAYLQLRNRRLVKLPDTRKQHPVHASQTTNPRLKSVPTEEDCGSEDEKSGSVGNFDSGDRETTPCNLISSAPSSREIEDFFAYAEQQQQRLFIDKYNFDIVSDHPLPGRYEWVKLVP